jgi:hypothetical protein
MFRGLSELESTCGRLVLGGGLRLLADGLQPPGQALRWELMPSVIVRGSERWGDVCVAVPPSVVVLA